MTSKSLKVNIRTQDFHELYLQLFVGGGMPYLRFLFIVESKTYYLVFLFCFSSSCVPYVASFSGWSFLIDPSVFSNVYYQ
jgi:hypothetical protein